jgi:hypothetical protein
VVGQLRGVVRLDDFVAKLLPRLLEWFFTMFRYASESKMAMRVVSGLIGLGGPFRDEELLRTV